jgi:hypothetical protein
MNHCNLKGKLSVEVAGEDLEEIRMHKTQIGEKVLLCQTDRIHVPVKRNIFIFKIYFDLSIFFPNLLVNKFLDFYAFEVTVVHLAPPHSVKAIEHHPSIEALPEI